eukprot:Skav226982  [mRNA]  locus=scaffold1937:47872:56495:+ [translate_table: standard]
MRGWRDCRAPQECLLTFLESILNELEDDLLEARSFWCAGRCRCPPGPGSASTWESCRPASPPTSSGRRCGNRRSAFVENPTRAPSHRNFRRFALLSAQMVAIGVELETEKVELLVRATAVAGWLGQVLNLNRPWRERRDMRSRILTAASVAGPQEVVESLDQRFEQHAEIDDFEIVAAACSCGAIRRCALRRWALDAKRGGALPVARLNDFVDRDVIIGEDVALSLRQRGRVVDAALLLSKLPTADPTELERLQNILSLADDGAFYADEESEFGPVDCQGFLLPGRRSGGAGLAYVTAAAADAACERLQEADLLIIELFRSSADGGIAWHSMA